MEVAASDTSRRSTRNRKKPKVDYAIANDESEDHEDSTDKKKKRKPKVIRKKAGKLADLPSLPLDVLFEVCYSLDRRSCRTVLIHVVDFRAPCALRPT